ncbi:Csu type fimbrial protein [Phyllobacterium meliloti]|uniref:Csu type fimbrial protein n=1 Tax=Phyllobacterium meliloti TaxID=555317 RepID=UPI001D13685D|nr:spore coat U domain-containing protein [Phyllobacterium sp. T1293]UGX89028.1 spore coat U domain-containing protein [Phyllobacterium sp. T1293]
MKIKMTLRLLFSFIPALVFPLMLILGTLSFVQPAFAKNCHFTSSTAVIVDVDLADIKQDIRLPDFIYTCELDKPLNQWYKSEDNTRNVCIRIEPVGSQIRDNYSFNLINRDHPDVKLGFSLYDRFAKSMNDERVNRYLSTNNDTALATLEYGNSVWRRYGGFTSEDWLAKGHLSSLRIQLLDIDGENSIQSGTYTGSYRVWIYQTDDSVNTNFHGFHCNDNFITSKSMLGTIDISLTIKKNCEVHSQQNINFNTQVATSLAMREHHADGSISIRCTKLTPYFIAFNQGQNNVDGVRHMKSADGKSFIPYELCIDYACNKPWKNNPIHIGQGEVAVIDKLNLYYHLYQIVLIFARIPKLPAAPSEGIYTDTVVYTITY